MPRPRQEIDAAVLRVRAEGLLPLPELSRVAGASPRTLERWVVEGRRIAGERVWLDGERDKLRTWHSSRQAVFRFLTECARLEELEAELEAERKAELARRGIREADLSVMAPAPGTQRSPSVGSPVPGCSDCVGRAGQSRLRGRARCGRRATPLRGWR